MASAVVDNDQVLTKQVTGRREVRYETFDDLLADAQRLVDVPITTLGNWTLPQILEHLAKSLHGMIDGVGMAMPMPVRWLMRLTMKKKMTTVAVPPGFQIPNAAKHMLPTETDSHAALERLRAAVERVKSEPKRAMHPAFARSAARTGTVSNCVIAKCI